MKTFYVTFKTDTPLKNVLLEVRSESRSVVIGRIKKHAPDALSEVYCWDDAKAKEKADKWGWTIVDGGIIE